MNLISLSILKLIARGRPCKQILLNNTPYLERFYLFHLFGYTCYLHRILSADADRDLHNYPWQSAYSLILNGSYIERRLEFGFQKRKIEYISPEVINITVKDNTLGTFYFYIINVYLQAMI